MRCKHNILIRVPFGGLVDKTRTTGYEGRALWNESTVKLWVCMISRSGMNGYNDTAGVYPSLIWHKISYRCPSSFGH